MTDIEVRTVGSIVVGSGIAGLTVALAHGDCVVVSKTTTPTATPPTPSR